MRYTTGELNREILLLPPASCLKTSYSVSHANKNCCIIIKHLLYGYFYSSKGVEGSEL
jgi:hypothetical protein